MCSSFSFLRYRVVTFIRGNSVHIIFLRGLVFIASDIWTFECVGNGIEVIIVLKLVGSINTLP